MQLVILAGGKGTRLGLTDIPKPMCPIAGKPLLERQIELAKTYGFDEIFILSGHLAHVISDYFGDGSRWGVKIHHIVEDKPLGTAGALKLIENKLAENFMVIYGDVVMDFDMQAMLAFANRMPAVATLLVHPNNHPYDSDLLQIDSRGRVTALLPKPHPDGLIYHNLVNAAVYVFNKKILSYIAADTAQDFGKDIFPRLLQAGETLRAYHSAEYVKDMGTKDRLPVICADVESGKVSRLNKKNARPAVFLDRDGVLNRDMDKAPRAENFELLPGVSEAVRLLNQSDYLSIVVTNQPMIANTLTLGNIDDARDYINIRDLTNCISMVLFGDKQQIKQLDIYNVGSGNAYSVRDILEIISRLTGRQLEIKIDSNRLRHDETSIEYADISKIKKTFGWNPQISLEQGIREILLKENLLKEVA